MSAIKTDKKTGRHYVTLGSKRIWLAKGMTERDVIKFLKKKKRNHKKRLAAKKKRKVTAKKPGVAAFGENKSMSSTNSLVNLAATLAFQAVKDKKADTNEVVKTAVKEILLLLPPAERAPAGKALMAGDSVKVDGQLVTVENIRNGMKALQHAQDEAKGAKRIAAKATKQVKKGDLEKLLNEKNDELQGGLDEFIKAQAKRDNKTTLQWLKSKLSEYELDPPAGRASIAKYADAVGYSLLEDKKYAASKTMRKLQTVRKEVANTASALEKLVDVERDHAHLSEFEEKEREEKYPAPPADSGSSGSEDLAQLLGDVTPMPSEYESDRRAPTPPNVEAIGSSAKASRASMREGMRQIDESRAVKIKGKVSRVLQYDSDEGQMLTPPPRHVNILHHPPSSPPIADEERRTQGMAEARRLAFNLTRGVELTPEEKEAYRAAHQRNNEAFALSMMPSDADDSDMSGEGRRKKPRIDSGEGLTTGQIDSLLKEYPEYVGCIASDEIQDLPVRANQRIGFVMNLDPHDKPGYHWVAVLIDARSSGGSNSVEYYDSLADPPTMDFVDRVTEMSFMMKGGNYMRFKTNKIRDQDNDSANCGWFASKFLMDRFSGKSFADASGYNKSFPEGERNIESWKREIGASPFKLLHQEGRGIGDMLIKTYGDIHPASRRGYGGRR